MAFSTCIAFTLFKGNYNKLTLACQQSTIGAGVKYSYKKPFLKKVNTKIRIKPQAFYLL